ncbi:MAG: PD-(D/E)XK nuclease family protein [Candidatus Eisenbacteria bacterium]
MAPILSADMPTFSNSRLNAYDNCPLQYRLRYVDEVEVPRRESIESFLGKRVHEALEFLYLNVSGPFKPTLGDVTERYREAWEREWSDAIHIVRSGTTVAGYQANGRRCLEQYYRRHDPFDRGRTVGAEVLVTYPLDPERDLHLRGYIDRLVDLGNGDYEIHDYKTGFRVPGQAELDRDRQLGLYQLAVTAQLPDVRSVKLVWHYLAHDRMMISIRTPDQLRDLRDRVIAQIAVIERATASGDLPPRVTPLCAWCEYKPVCSAWNPDEHAALRSGSGLGA